MASNQPYGMPPGFGMPPPGFRPGAPQGPMTMMPGGVMPPRPMMRPPTPGGIPMGGYPMGMGAPMHQPMGFPPAGRPVMHFPGAPSAVQPTMQQQYQQPDAVSGNALLCGYRCGADSSFVFHDCFAACAYERESNSLEED